VKSCAISSAIASRASNSEADRLNDKQSARVNPALLSSPHPVIAARLEPGISSALSARRAMPRRMKIKATYRQFASNSLAALKGMDGDIRPSRDMFCSLDHKT
jgi:hypothetical protein